MKCPGGDRDEPDKRGDHIVRMPGGEIDAHRHLIQNVKNKVPDCNSQESDAEIGGEQQEKVKGDRRGSYDGTVASYCGGDRENQNYH